MYVSNRASTTLGSIGPMSGASPRTEAEGAPAATSGDAAAPRVSGPARLMGKLSQLRDSNPAQLSQVVSSLASGLREVAAQDSGVGAKMLTALASKLDDIARGGDISQLAPAAAPEDTLGSLAARLPLSAPSSGQPPPAEASHQAELEQGSPPRAAAAYRANAETPGPGVDARRAALAQMLDELDAALKATGTAKGAAPESR